MQSIAAPVRDPSGEVVAPVAVTGAAELGIRERADMCAPRRKVEARLVSVVKLRDGFRQRGCAAEYIWLDLQPVQ